MEDFPKATTLNALVHVLDERGKISIEVEDPRRISGVSRAVLGTRYLEAPGLTGVCLAGGPGVAAGAAAVAAPLSYRSIMSLVMSMVLDAYRTGVCGELTSRISVYPLSFAYLSITAIIFWPSCCSTFCCS